MHFFRTTIVALILAFQSRAAEEPAHGEAESKEMGPVAFMWPSDRVWSEKTDNAPPCGSAAQPGNRTNFPLMRGAVALVIQDESWNVEVAVAYGNNPVSESDFSGIRGMRADEVNEGHVCYALPESPRAVTDGSNATIQLKYTSDFGTDKNQTFYACADITYVDSAAFTTPIPCFNVTSEEFVTPKESGSVSVHRHWNVALAAILGLAAVVAAAVL
ncbi:hypothetical protein EJ08DRAFT_666082 [Tothia fuscella]|uniref:Copper acquisition factor BIM1-like domain-containing protein n=1 Tax=Tothia fuscella TaxID=1048955 RepID=A0A9P4NFP2_9PEZI|nr:hypothetical protein EJ08DRAFT_666082 [Tothia fuscella]